MYLPVNYKQINVGAGLYNPSPVKSYNNEVFDFWVRSLFQRACSTIIFERFPYSEKVLDFLYWCVFRFGFVVFFDIPEMGFSFQPANLSGYDFYYQFTTALVSNPALKGKSLEFTIGKDCEVLKLTPDYMGIFDIIYYYAEKLASLDNGINMSIINGKLAYILGAKNKTTAQALKKITDFIQQGKPTVVFDLKLLHEDGDNDDPFQVVELNPKNVYLTTDQLRDFQTILNNFDCEIGIPTIPYEKKERMVTSEAESRVIDSTSRSVIWFDCLSKSLKDVNRMFGTDLGVRMRYADSFNDKSVDTVDNEQKEGEANE